MTCTICHIRILESKMCLNSNLIYFISFLQHQLWVWLDGTNVNRYIYVQWHWWIKSIIYNTTPINFLHCGSPCSLFSSNVFIFSSLFIRKQSLAHKAAELESRNYDFAWAIVLVHSRLSNKPREHLPWAIRWVVHRLGLYCIVQIAPPNHRHPIYYQQLEWL